MSLQITVRMPDSTNLSRRAAVIKAIESKTSKAFRVQFLEAEGVYAGRVDVECHNKGVGPLSREKWTVAAREALNVPRP